MFTFTVRHSQVITSELVRTLLSELVRSAVSDSRAPSIPTQSSARAVASRRICAGSAETLSHVFSAKAFTWCTLQKYSLYPILQPFGGFHNERHPVQGPFYNEKVIDKFLSMACGAGGALRVVSLGTNFCM